VDGAGCGAPRDSEPGLIDVIRPATSADIPRMVELGRVMHGESPVFCRLTFDAEKLAATIASTIASPAGFARVSEHDGVVIGGMVAMVSPHWFSPDLVACDLALFIDPEYRGGMSAVRLISAYTAWAKGHGAALIQIVVMTGVNVDKTEALLHRLGWHRSGLVMEF